MSKLLRQFNMDVGLPMYSGENRRMSQENNFNRFMSKKRKESGPKMSNKNEIPMHLMTDKQFEVSGGTVSDVTKQLEMEALRKAQGQFEGQLDKMIAPTQGDSIGASINTTILKAKAFFGDKMAEHAVQKMAAKKALEKGTEKVLEKGVEKGIGKGAMANIALDAAGVDVKQGLSEVTGSNQLGGMAGGALKAGLSSGFNPVAMGAGAIMGLLSGAESDRQRRRQAQAQALRAKAGGQINKARAQANLARSMQNTLLSGLQRKVNL